MSDQDTVQTQPSLTTTEIMTIILGCEQTLRFVQASPNYKQIEASERFSTSNDLKMGDAVQALMEIHEAIARAAKHSDRPTKYVSLAAKRKVHKDFSSMTLDYKNPNDWGKSPLTDSALRKQQFKAENPEEWSAMIEADIEALDTSLDESENYPPFTGTEFLATHSTIDDHPYSAAFGQFLGNGIDPDIANTLAFGENRFDLISDDFDDPVRQLVTRIYSRFEDMGYWDEEVPSDDDDIDCDNIPY